jgi:hypothetical protein
MVTWLGVVLIVAAVVLLLADWGRLSDRMPTQVPPRAFALLPLCSGVVLLVVGLAYGY